MRFCIFTWWRRISAKTTIARRIAAPPTAIPTIAPRESFAADDEDFASAAAVAAALLVLVLEVDVVDEDELAGLVADVVVGVALVTKVVGDC